MRRVLADVVVPILAVGELAHEAMGEAALIVLSAVKAKMEGMEQEEVLKISRMRRPYILPLRTVVFAAGVGLEVVLLRGGVHAF